MTPTSERELAEVVTEAATAGMPLRIRGGGSRAGLGHAVVGDVLDTGGLSGVTLYEPGALTLVARAGTPMTEVEAALASEGQQLPFEPMDHRALYGGGAPTIGGVVATNASGPRRIQAGACRDSLIGVRFVDGRGTILKNGGRVMKNVTGYDLVKLMAGSQGTLGVLTEVSFKVLPAAEAEATVIVQGLGPHQAVAAMSAALGAPYDVSGAAHFTGPDGARTLVRVEGFEGSVTYRAGQLKDLLGAHGVVEVVSDAAIWTELRDGRPVVEGEGDVWRISVKPTDGAAVAAALGPEAAVQMDWGGGLVWARVTPGRDIRSALDGIAGHATLMRASDQTKAALGVFPPEPAALTRISAGLRAQFDPKGILNPGRMG